MGVIVTRRIRDTTLIDNRQDGVYIDEDIQIKLFDPRGENQQKVVEGEEDGEGNEKLRSRKKSTDNGMLFPDDDLREIRYGQVRSKKVRLEGSWLGNVCGGLVVDSPEFAKNTQVFLLIDDENTTIELLLEQGIFTKENVNAKLFIFKLDDKQTTGYVQQRFNPQQIHWQSNLFMSNSIVHSVELPKSEAPYVLVVSHSRVSEGKYTLHIECEKEIVVRVPRTFCELFDQPSSHHLSFEGEWKNKSAGGPPPEISWESLSAQSKSGGDPSNQSSVSTSSPTTTTTSDSSSASGGETMKGSQAGADFQLPSQVKTSPKKKKKRASQVIDSGPPVSLPVPPRGRFGVGGRATTPNSPVGSAQNSPRSRRGNKKMSPKKRLMMKKVQSELNLVKSGGALSSLLGGGGDPSSPSGKNDKRKGRKRKKKKLTWLSNPQFPLISRKFAKCWITMRRKSARPMTMGLYIVKMDPPKTDGSDSDEGDFGPSGVLGGGGGSGGSGGGAGNMSGNRWDLNDIKRRAGDLISRAHTKYYSKDILELDNLVARTFRMTCKREVSFRCLLLPNEDPYVLIPFTNRKGRVGEFSIDIHSDEAIHKLRHDKVEKVFTEKGKWMERTCGGRPGTKDTYFFNSPQFFLTIRYAKDSPFKPEDGRHIYAQLTIEQDVNAGDHMPVGFYVVVGGYRFTKHNWKDEFVRQDKIPQYKRIINADLRLTDGQSYTVIPYPKVHNYSRDTNFSVRVKTHLPSDTEISFKSCPVNDEEFANLDEFHPKELTGTWEMLTSGGSDPINDSTFYNNPQFNIVIKSKTKTHICLERLTDHWHPMGFFIIQLYGITEKRITHLPNVVKKRDGTYSHSKVDKQHRIIDQVRFTNGVPKKVLKNVVLPCGCYVVICCSKTKGKSGEFKLTLRTHKVIRTIPFLPVDTKTVSFISGFLGGLNCLYPPEKNDDVEKNYWKNNPKYHLSLLSQTGRPMHKQDVVIVIRRPDVQQAMMCVYLMEEDGLTPIMVDDAPLQSGVSKGREVILTCELAPGKYTIVVGIDKGTEGQFEILVQSAPQAPKNESDVEIENKQFFNLVKGDNVVDFFSERELSFCTEKFSVKTLGIVGKPEKLSSNFNPTFKLFVEEKTRVQVEILIHSGSPEYDLGFMIDKFTDGGEKKERVYRCDIEHNKRSIIRKMVLEAGDYLIELYPLRICGNVGAYMKLRSDIQLRCEAVKKDQKLREFRSAWNLGRVPSPLTSNERFWFNPHYVIHVDEGKDVVVSFRLNKNKEGESKGLSRVATSARFKSTLSNTNLAALENPLSSDTIVQLIEEAYTDSKVAMYLLHAKGKKDVKDFSLVSAAEIYSHASWNLKGSSDMMVVLEESKWPYFLVPVTTNPHQDRNFDLSIFSDVKIKFEMSPWSVENVKSDEVAPRFFGEEHLDYDEKLKGKLSLMEYPEVQWRRNSLWEFEAKKDLVVNIVLKKLEVEGEKKSVVGQLEKKDHSIMEKIGWCVLQKPQGSSEFAEKLADNIIVIDTLKSNSLSVEKLCCIKKSSEKYYLIATSEGFTEERFLMQVSSNEELAFKETTPLDTTHMMRVHFHGGFNLGIMGGSPGSKADEICFKNNPRWDMRTKDKDMTVFLCVKSKSILQMKLVMSKRKVSAKQFESFEEIEIKQRRSIKLELKKNVVYRMTPTILPKMSEGQFDIHMFFEGKKSCLEVSKIQGLTDADNSKMKSEFILKGKWDPQAHFGPNSITLNQSMLLKDLSKVIGKLTYNKLQKNPSIFLEVKRPTLMIRILLMHSRRSFQAISFIVERKDPALLMYYHPPMSFRSSLSATLFLPRGEYRIIMFMQSTEGQISVGSTFPFNVVISTTEEVYFETEMLNAKTLQAPLDPCELGTIPQSIYYVLNNVKKIFSTSKNENSPSPLVVFGHDICPIFMGVSSVEKMFNFSTLSKTKLFFKHNKLGFSSNTGPNGGVIDIPLPFIAAGKLGLGKVIVIGDTHLFSKENLEKGDNRTFLLNCCEYITKKMYKNVSNDFLDSQGNRRNKGLMGRRNSLGGSGTLIEEMRPQSPMGPGKGKIKSQSIMQCYSKGIRIPTEDLKRAECRINVLQKLSELKSSSGNAGMFLVFGEDEKLTDAEIENIHKQIEKDGIGAIILTRSRSPSVIKLLQKFGVVVGEGEVLQNCEYNFDKFWWMSHEEMTKHLKTKKMTAQNDLSFEVDGDTAQLHVNFCLERYLYLVNNPPGSSNSKALISGKMWTRKRISNELEILFKLVAVLEMACWTIPPSDIFIFPELMKHFAKPYLAVDKSQGIKYLDFENRLSLAINTNLWRNTSPYINPSLKLEEHEIKMKFSGEDNLKSTGVFVRAMESVKIKFSGNKNHSLIVIVGELGPNLLWMRDYHFKKYPLVWNNWIVEPGQKVLSLMFNFGGLIYIATSKNNRRVDCLKDIVSSRSEKICNLKLSIKGGVKSSKFVQSSNKTIVNDESPWCEWEAPNVIITIPLYMAQLVKKERRLKILEYFNRVVELLHEFTGVEKSQKKNKMKMMFCSQVPFDGSFAGTENVVCFDEKTFWEKIYTLDAVPIIKEMALLYHKNQHYLWKHRLEAIIKCTLIYILEQIQGKSFKEKEFYDLKQFKDHLMSSNDKGKKLENITHLQYFSLFELVFVEEFGWEPFKNIFKKYRTEQRFAKFLSNKDKLDSWVVALSNEVKKDLSSYFEIFGYKISQTVKNRTKSFPKWVPLD